MGPISNDEFFHKLTELFNTRKDKSHGSVYLTQKRFPPEFNNETQQNKSPEEAEADILAELHPENPLPVLIRATNGKGKDRRSDKIKFETLVQPGDLESFYVRYAEACKTGMAILKPRDRTKRKAKARKKKGGPAAATA